MLGPHSQAQRGTAGGSLACPFSQRSPAPRAATRGYERRPARAVPFTRLGPAPSRLLRSRGTWGRDVGWAHGLGEAAPGDGSCDHELSARTSSSCCLDGAWLSAQCSQSRATVRTPHTAEANSTDLGHDPLRPNTAETRTPSPTTPTPPGLRCVCGSSASGSLATGSGLGFDSDRAPDPAASPAVRTAWVPAGSLHPGVQGPGCHGWAPLLLLLPARRPRGRRGHGLGRREGGRGSEALACTSGEGAVSSPLG